MISRRSFSAAAAGLAALGAGHAFADVYPSKAVRFVVPFAPGGSADIMARTVGTMLGEALGQPVAVENAPGAGGELGVSTVLRRPADGYTVLVTPNGPITTGGLFRKQPYDVAADLIPISQLGIIPSVFAVNASIPARTLTEFAAWAKARGTKPSCGNPGSGSGNHLAAELLAHAMGVPMTPVPYRGSSNAALALMGGELDCASGDLSSYLPHAKAGKVRILATYEPRRATGAPDIPTVVEAGYPSFGHFTGWIGMYVAAGTPTEIVDRLSGEVARLLQRAELRRVVSNAGIEPGQALNTQQLAQYIREEIAFLTRQVRDAGIKLG